MQIRSDLDLPTLRILLDPARRSFSHVVFQAVRGRGTPTEVARCSLRDLGLPDTLRGMQPIDDDALAVPSGVMSALGNELSSLGPSPEAPQSALWLEFPSPRGYLYVVPWERLLAPLGRSLFRLPNHLVRPQAPSQTLEVAICASAPIAKAAFAMPEIMVALSLQYLKKTGHDVTVHLFADANWHSFLQNQAAHFDALVVHNPLESTGYERPERTTRIGTSARVSNPWLQWMRDAMQGRPLDFVHFVSHGYLSGDRGAIAVASTPILNTDRELSRFIGAVELTTFMSQVGAWGLALTGPPQNFCEAGLRELADAVALVRPGVNIAHDFARDVDCTQFGLALQTFLAPGSQLDGPLPATTCWVHPRFVEFPEEFQGELHLNIDGSSAFIADATRDALSDHATESWVASASRSLEMQQVRWLPDTLEDPVDPAAVTALRNVADLVERHVSRAYPGRGTFGGTT